MLPELARQASSLGSIEFTKGGDKLTLERAGEQWKLKERGGYPVQADKVRALVVQLADAKLVEPRLPPRSAGRCSNSRIPQDKDAKSALVRLLDAHGKPISELVIGKTHPNAFGTGRGGIYVRRPGETQTWLASGEPNVTLDVKDWVDTAIYKADVPKFKRVTVEHANEVPIVVEKGSEPNAKFALKSVPEGVKVKPNAPVDQIALGFSSIDLEDVRKLDTTPIGETVSVITTESTDGSDGHLPPAPRGVRRPRRGSRSRHRARATPRRLPTRSTPRRRAGSSRSPTGKRTRSASAPPSFSKRAEVLAPPGELNTRAPIARTR